MADLDIGEPTAEAYFHEREYQKHDETADVPRRHAIPEGPLAPGDHQLRAEAEARGTTFGFSKNLTKRFDCFAKAEPDEPMFVLLARDDRAPVLVEQWAEMTERRGATPEKAIDARECARQMREWRAKNRPDTGTIVDETTEHTRAQPAPKQDENAAAVWPLIIADIERDAADHFRIGTPRDVERARALRRIAADMRARHEFGVAKYGVPLVADNARDHLSDAYQEILDGMVYLWAEIEKRGGFMPGSNQGLVSLYGKQRETAFGIRELLALRDGR